MKAIIYTKNYCSFCKKAKDLLNDKNIPYEEYIIDVFGKGKRILNENQHWATSGELLEKRPSSRTVPQIWLDDKYIGGFTELRDLLDTE